MNDLSKYSDGDSFGGGYYPSPPDPEEPTNVKVSGYFEGYISLYGNNQDEMREEINSMFKSDLIKELDIKDVRIEDIDI